MITPLVSGLMITKNRARLVPRALHSFETQSWPNKELIIIDHGSEDLTSIVAAHTGFPIHYERVRARPDQKLGALRNIAMERARGEFWVPWDDDDWSHPRRIERQVRAVLREEIDGVYLQSEIVHLDTPEFLAHPFRARLRPGILGTTLHRSTSLRYRNLARREDTVFAQELAARARVVPLREPHSHLFVRCFHGANTWHLDHFTYWLRDSPSNALRYLHARFIARDLFSHRAFQLNRDELASFGEFLRVSRELGIFPDPQLGAGYIEQLAVVG